MGVWSNIKQLFGAAEIETRNGFSDSFETKKAFDSLRIGVVGRPQYPDTNEANLMVQQRRNELVFACLQKKAQAAIDPEPIVERKNGKGKWEAVAGHPLVNLINKPNPIDDGGTFLGAWLNSEDLTGKFYAEIIRNNLGEPVQLWILNPARIRPVPGYNKDGSNIAWYEFDKGNGQKLRMETTEILRRHNKDITNQFGGLSPTEACLGAIDTDSALTDFVRGVLGNGGVPSGILKFTNKTITDEQAQLYQQKWTNRYGRGGRQQNGIAILDQNADYQKIGFSLSETESDKTRSQAESRICSVYGVPPVLVGAYVGLLHSNTRASARDAQDDFWINTMSPIFKKLRMFLTWNLLPEFESIDEIKAGMVRVAWDMTHVLGLQEDVDNRHDRLRKDFEAGVITLNQYLQETGRETDAFGDYYLRDNRRIAVTPENAKKEAELEIVRVPPATVDIGTGDNADPSGDKPKQLNAPKNLDREQSEPLQLPARKSFEWQGLELSREPNEIEKKLDLKAMNQSFESSKDSIATVLANLRLKLIEQAVEEIVDAATKELHQVNLTPAPKFYKQVRDKIDLAFEIGRKQVAKELSAKKSIAETKDADFTEFDDDLDELTDLSVSRVVNDVQTRAIASAASLLVLGIAATEIRSRLKGILGDGSSGYILRAAQAAANAAIAAGREAEIKASSDEWENLVYSALLDKNCCGPCTDADGLEANSYDDLPDTPNPDCDGLDLCRCMIIAVSK